MAAITEFKVKPIKTAEDYQLHRDRLHEVFAEMKTAHGLENRKIIDLIKNHKDSPNLTVESLGKIDFASVAKMLDANKPVGTVISHLKNPFKEEITPDHPLVTEARSVISALKAAPKPVREEVRKSSVGALALGRELYFIERANELIDHTLSEAGIRAVKSGVSAPVAHDQLNKLYKEAEVARNALEKRKDEIYKEGDRLKDEYGSEKNEAVMQHIYYRIPRDKRALKEGFMPTEVYKELERNYDLARSTGKFLWAWGYTGTGKTEALKYLLRKRTGKEPIVFGCSGDTTQYDLFGIGEASTVREKDGKETTRIGTKPAGISQALDEKRPIIIDEANALRPEIWPELNPILDALSKHEKKVYVPVLGRTIDLEDTPITLTGNLKVDGYYGRFDVDAATSRRTHNFMMDYPTVDDLHRMLVAELVDGRTLRAPSDEIIAQGQYFSEAVKIIQDTHSGKINDLAATGSDLTRGEGSKLPVATTSPGDYLSILRAWKASNYNDLSVHILDHIKQQNTSKEEKQVMLQVFKSKGFFEGWDARRVKDIVSASTWQDWDLAAKNQAQPAA